MFFVALPLCLGIALASGAPLYSGILSGIIGGLFVPLLSRSELSVSGPAAGLATVVAAAIVSSGSYERFMSLLLIAGLVQVALGLFRLGGIGNYFPSAVIKGMLAAIGLLLIKKQLPIALGYDKPDFWSPEFFSIIRPSLFEKHPGVIILSAVSLVLLVLFEQPRFRRYAILPVPLILVLLSMLISLAFRFAGGSLALTNTQMVAIPANFFADIRLPELSGLLQPASLKTGAVIGLLASLETLLSIEAVDKLDPWHRSSPANRELMVQGAANLFCGLVGALPITAVIVRSSANISAGGRTRMSAFIHGLLLLLAVLALVPLINLIPYAVLASLLIMTGFNLTRPKLYRSIFRLGWNQFLPFIITIVGVVFTDLLIGVSIGLVLSVYFLVRDSYKVQFDVEESSLNGEKKFVLRLHSNVSFLDKVKIKSVLNAIPKNSILEIDGSQSQRIHYDVLEAIAEFADQAPMSNIQVITTNIPKVEVSSLH